MIWGWRLAVEHTYTIHVSDTDCAPNGPAGLPTCLTGVNWTGVYNCGLTG